MKHEPLEVIRGSGNVYRDLGQDDADVKQFKALLAAEIIKALGQGRPDSARGARAHWHRGSGLFSNPQCRPRPLHARSPGGHH